MPCKECGCCIPDYHKDVEKIEKYQSMIDDLYEKSPILKAEIRRLKIKRDKLLKGILSMLEEKEYWIRRELLRDRCVPIDWCNSQRLDGRENEEATDWEYDEVSTDED